MMMITDSGRGCSLVALEHAYIYIIMMAHPQMHSLLNNTSNLRNHQQRYTRYKYVLGLASYVLRLLASLLYRSPRPASHTDRGKKSTVDAKLALPVN
jgi:hypothetical protein